MIVAGFDEAGYGPLLGPLVVGSSAFEVPGDILDLGEPGIGEPDLWEELGDAVRREGKGDKNKLWVADSKVIKPRKDGLKNLELGVLAFRGLREASSLEALIDLLGAGRGYARQPWFQGFNEVKVPEFAWTGEVAARADRYEEAAKAADIRFLGAEVRLLDAHSYNERVAATKNKAALLEEACVSMISSLRKSTRGPMRVTCDKHGGRSTYLRLCGKAFPLCELHILEEGPDISTYTTETPQGPVWISFRKGGEDKSLAVALASMHCKYLRERCMERFNAWWGEQIEGLKPTAGYAVDGKRFIQDVAPELRRLGVARQVLVRQR